ncbi:olfactory receptor 51E2-like [Microcaecilia unicolor]|uniref:Olfactory receptor n=1 Tax=Microcaecilia unicolor TaxID=1415580 RepID=A0A6P7XPT6_9AMPH|nr:olfactory receptor 51E2-like [Microcaecilia unicolor]
MISSNATGFSHSSFILIGIPGLEAAHIWIAFPLCSIYIITLLGNTTILFIIKTEPSLHEPMYIFLSILAVIDLLLSTSTMPKMLMLLWFDRTEISFDACLIQMFLIHSLSAIESTILVAMAFDRFIAICHPLTHASILTIPVIAKVALMAIVRGVLFFAPFPLLIMRLPFCRNNVLSHSYCVHQDVMKLACADITPSIVYGLLAILLVMGVDSLLIFLSYVIILRTVLKLASRQERLKAFNTCVSHLCAVLTFYIPLIGLSVIHRFGNSLAPTAHNFMGNVYLLVPPALNPIVYGVKTKQIRRRALKIFQRRISMLSLV